MNYLSALSIAVRNRAIADTTLVGGSGYVATAGLRYNFGGVDTALPFIVYSFTDHRRDDAFRTERWLVTMTWDVFVAEEPQAVSPDPFLSLHNITSRLSGDWSAQVYGTAPTYGFNRWQPTVSGWSPNHFEHISTTPAHEPGVLHDILTFTIGMNKAGA